jgi:hypothetical protein
VSEGKTHHELTKNNPTLAQNLRGAQQFPLKQHERGRVGRADAWTARCGSQPAAPNLDQSITSSSRAPFQASTGTPKSASAGRSLEPTFVTVDCGVQPAPVFVA